MGPLVLTNCTSRKSKGPRVQALPTAAWTSVGDAARCWHQKTEATSGRSAAASVYQGRSVQEALACARKLDAQVWFVSAGLGLVHSDTLIPRYDLTLSQGNGCIAHRLESLSATASDWWAALVRLRGPSFADLIEKQRGGAVYIALPSAYLTLISRELEAIADSGHANRLWIFTGAPGRRALPAAIRPRALPYDRRLEAVGPAGTQADFPQRCLKHFIGLSLQADISSDAANEAVEQSLAGQPLPQRPIRRTVTDAEAMQLIREHWQGQLGQSGRLLRHLRSGLGVACEQDRFRQLYHHVRGTIAEDVKGVQTE